ncbi:MAG: IPTL-CTERM sorting domain-containing protein [Acidobacteriota bacterium]
MRRSSRGVLLTLVLTVFAAHAVAQRESATALSEHLDALSQLEAEGVLSPGEAAKLEKSLRRGGVRAEKAARRLARHGGAVASEDLRVASAESEQALGLDPSRRVLGGISEDQCPNALSVNCGTTLNRSSVGASFGGGHDCDHGQINNAWYYFVGTGDAVTVSLCDSNFDTELAILRGGCGDLVCLISGDDVGNCDGDSEALSFCSELGQDYHFVVGGFGGETGDITLEVTCTAGACDPPDNDDCADATTIGPGTWSGSTLAAESSFFEQSAECQDAGSDHPDRAGVWYHLTGTGTELRLSLCEGTLFDTELLVFTGSCAEGLACVAGHDDSDPCDHANEEITFCAGEGFDYYVLVTGFEETRGLFELEVEVLGTPCTPEVVPTLPEWGLMALMAALGGLGVVILRRG